MEYSLHIDNVFSQLLTDDQEFRDKLWAAMRFREKGYFFSPAFKQHRWDGYREFFSKKNGKFLTGLLPEVEYALRKYNHDFTATDKREQIKFPFQNVDNQFLNKWMPPDAPGITLYDYQVDLINQAIKYKRGIVKAPTGAGKTGIFIGILRALPSVPALVIQDTKDLCEQNYDNLVKWGFKNVGMYYGSTKKTQRPNIITCVTVQSLKKLEPIFPKIKAIFVDEVHDLISDVPVSVYKKLIWTPIRIGISATPFKDKTHRFKVRGHFGAPFKTKATESGELTTAELQQRGILSGSVCTFYEVDEPQIPYEIYQDAVKYGLEENHHLHEMVKKIALAEKGRRLIIVERLAQGDSIAAMIPGACWIQGKDDVSLRKAVVEKLKSADNIIAIVSQKLISKGLDVKIHSLINVAGGKAAHSMIQRMGRGLRLAGDKDILHYYDFLFNINDYLRDHSEERIKIIRQEGHPLVIKEEFDL
jgi:superfamily II DNA or RNA helicase